MPTLSYDEGVPGHHWQISIAYEIKDAPQFRRVIPFTAYMEGWAFYSEWLAKQAGWYEGAILFATSAVYAMNCSARFVCR